MASFPDHGANGKDVIKAADAALSRAKEEGRDRVVVANSVSSNRAPLDHETKRLELLHLLNEFPGFSIPSDGINWRPSLALAAQKDEVVLQKFLDVKAPLRQGPKRVGWLRSLPRPSANNPPDSPYLVGSLLKSFQTSKR